MARGSAAERRSCVGQDSNVGRPELERARRRRVGQYSASISSIHMPSRGRSGGLPALVHFVQIDVTLLQPATKLNRIPAPRWARREAWRREGLIDKLTRQSCL